MTGMHQVLGTLGIMQLLTLGSDSCVIVAGIIAQFATWGMAFGAFLSWLIGRGISRPVQSMTQVMTSLAHGDLRVEIPALGNKDELGDMARAVVVFRDAAIDKIRME